nr:MULTISPECIES: PfkB family carbohydrate kinase [unclassified Arthrobacter]
MIDIITTSAGPVEFAGGSGLNVAYGLGRLGADTGLLTVLGADQRAEAIRQHRIQLQCSLCPVPPA